MSIAWLQRAKQIRQKLKQFHKSPSRFMQMNWLLVHAIVLWGGLLCTEIILRWVLCIKQDPHEYQDPRFPLHTLTYRRNTACTSHQVSCGAEAADVSIHGADYHVTRRTVWWRKKRDVSAVRPQHLSTVLGKENKHLAECKCLTACWNAPLWNLYLQSWDRAGDPRVKPHTAAWSRRGGKGRKTQLHPHSDASKHTVEPRHTEQIHDPWFD